MRTDINSENRKIKKGNLLKQDENKTFINPASGCIVRFRFRKLIPCIMKSLSNLCNLQNKKTEQNSHSANVSLFISKVICSKKDSNIYFFKVHFSRFFFFFFFFLSSLTSHLPGINSFQFEIKGESYKEVQSGTVREREKKYRIADHGSKNFVFFNHENKLVSLFFFCSYIRNSVWTCV